ncbi:hypothetical protein R7P34_13060 [Vibrio sp. 780]|uniref:hypothetical protein n=1 Tax=unclassified Vibrio TaxID=2614977 RepID=UPI00296427F3|nr:MULTISPECIES: hypothetical protein [unclassified Vibrio]MDW1948755.1 hypothetical protein [Vibrio sp. 812(2023)]MDW1991335.1 hypothetical protein [Vibrio sp. 780]
MKKIVFYISTAALFISPLTNAAWNTSIDKDEMTGEIRAYANSPTIQSTKKMSFPYSSTRSWLGVGCNQKGEEWIYVGFTNAPNLNGTETKDGYNLISTRVKWDNNIESTKLIQDWGSKFIHFRNDKNAIKNALKSNQMLLELNWHSQGNQYFKYSLNGSSAAIKTIRSKCKAS